MNEDYNNLVKFWNSNYILNDEMKEEIRKETNIDNFIELAPSIKFIDVLKLFSNKYVLDYGCGNGWASIILSKLNAKFIDACEVADVKKVIDFYSDLYKVSNKNYLNIDSNWLKNVDSNKYEGFFSSNVVDVLPLDMSKEIIKEASRIVKNDSYVIFSMNYYIDPKVMANKGCKVVGKQIYVDDVLRLTSLTDQEWIDIFKLYYKEINIKYFSWPGETEEKRRIFILKK